MIIKASLRALRREDATPTRSRRRSRTSTKRSTRLNRIVTEVLDFARPIKFDLAAGRSERAVPRRRQRRRRRGPGDAASASISIRASRRSPPTPSGFARRSSTSWQRRPRGGRSGRRGADPTSGCGPLRVDAPAASPSTVADSGTGIAAGGPAAGVRSLLHDARGRVPGIGLAISRQHHRGTGGRSPSPASANGAPRCVSSSRLTRRPHDQNAPAPSFSSTTKPRSARRWRRRCARTATKSSPTGSPREAQRLLARGSFDVLLVDNLMPELTGLDLIRELVALDRPRPIGRRSCMMTAHATVESAIEAMKLGALDYLQKPFEIDELLVVVNRALDHQRLRTQHGYLLSERDEEFNQYGIVGRSRRDAGRDPDGARWSPSRRAPCSSPARPAPARRWWRARSTSTARSARCRW